MAEKAIIVNTPKNKIQSDAQDWASIFNSIIGDQSGVLTYGEQLKLTKKNDNEVVLHDGVYSMQGHFIQVERGSTVDLMVDSGTLGIERVDSVVVEYIKNGDRTENDTFEFKVIKGEPQVTGGNAVAPTLLQEDLLGGGLKRQERLFDLSINGTELTVIDKRSYVNSMKEHADRVESGFQGVEYIDITITTNQIIKKYKSGILEISGTYEGVPSSSGILDIPIGVDILYPGIHMLPTITPYFNDSPSVTVVTIPPLKNSIPCRITNANTNTPVTTSQRVAYNYVGRWK